MKYFELKLLVFSSYPCFENPSPMDIHESPVTACKYYADGPPDLIPAFDSVGSKQKKTGFSEKVRVEDSVTDHAA
jgi:syntaxin-binding protein 5